MVVLTTQQEGSNKQTSQLQIAEQSIPRPPQQAEPLPKAAHKSKKGRKSKRMLRQEALAEATSVTATTRSVTVTKLPSTDKLTVVKTETHVANKQVKRSRDVAHPPSQESGGVPEPTIQYLLRAQAPPRLLTEPRRILVIMDLNGTLLHRPYKRRPFHFIERPHAKSFLNYCLDNFHVAIWSSARPDNVEKMVQRLLTPKQVQKCLLVWGRDKFGLSATDYDSRVQCYKRLTRVWSDPRIMESHPAAATGGRWDQTNTVLVDDSIEKARSEPHNLLQIPDFTGLEGEPPNVLPQVHDYLNSLCHQTNISSYIRETPFNLDPSYTLNR